MRPSEAFARPKHWTRTTESRSPAVPVLFDALSAVPAQRTGVASSGSEAKAIFVVTDDRSVNGRTNWRVARAPSIENQ